MNKFRAHPKDDHTDTHTKTNTANPMNSVLLPWIVFLSLLSLVFIQSSTLHLRYLDSKLKQAKEKLRRLQDLVALVQQSPDNGLPSDLAELASGFDSDILSELAELSQAEPAQQQPRRSPGGGAAGTRAVGTSSAAGEPSQNSPSLAMSAEER